jgi:hypothetical protein
MSTYHIRPDNSRDSEVGAGYPEIGKQFEINYYYTS